MIIGRDKKADALIHQTVQSDYNPKDVEKRYNLEYVKNFLVRPEEQKMCRQYSFHQISIERWRLTIQLDEKRIWFLTVFFHENGEFDHFSLDCETDEDSHYLFAEEDMIREKLYQPGDEELYFDEIIERYVCQFGGNSFLGIIRPYITEEFHFD